MSTENENSPTTSESAADVQTQPAAQPAGDGVWDSLNEMQLRLAQYGTAPALVAPLLRNREVVARVEDKKALIENAQLLDKDTREYAGRLSAIHARHAGRTGSSANGDELNDAIQINEDYVDWINSYDSVVMPTVTALLGQFEKAGADTNAFAMESPAALVDSTVDADVDAGTVTAETTDAAA